MSTSDHSSDRSSGHSSAKPETAGTLCFGPFAFEVAASRLSRDGVEIHLTPKAATVLVLLLQRPGELISKDEFLETVWEGVHVREESLTQAISVIRQALGDAAQSPQFIQTVSGEGYRFVGEVVVGATGVEETIGKPIPHRGRRTPWPTVVWRFGAVGLVLAIAVTWLLGSSTVDRPPIRSLAILPLKHLGEPSEAYFTDAMTELLSARLGRIRGLRVIALPPTGRSATAAVVSAAGAADLGADALIDGSVLWNNERVRIIVRLVDGSSGEQLQQWEFVPTVRDVLSVQSEIARAVVDQIELAPSATEERLLASPTQPVSFEAFAEWAAGTAIAMRRLGEGLDQAIEHFDAALSIDPDYADAQQGLAISYAQLGTYGLLPPYEAFPKAREAALRAIEIDDTGGSPYITLAWTAFVYEHDFEIAAANFRRGLELSPNDFGGHHQQAWFHMANGRFDEARSSMQRALERAPGSLVTHAQFALPSYFRRDYNAALGHALRTREMDPSFGNAYVQLGRIHLARGEASRAVNEFLRARELTPHPRLLGDLALAYGAAGRVSDAAATLTDLEAIAVTEATYVEPLAFAWAHLALADHDRALDWLREAIERGGNPLPLLIEWDPKYDPLRRDPRFQALVDRVRALRR